MARVCGSNRLSTFCSEGTFLPSSTRLRVCAITCFTRGTSASICVRRRFACCSVCWLSAVTTRVACRTICSAVSTSFWYNCFCSASLSSPLRRNCRCNCCATRLAERSRARQVCSTERTCSATSPLARLTKRERTRTLSTSSPLSVGWWISVCTQVASSRSLRPCVTLACLANSTTWSLSWCSVSGCSVLAQRIRVVSSGAGSQNRRENQRNTRLSSTRSSVS